MTAAELIRRVPLVRRFGPALPTVAVVPDDELLDKNRSTLEQIRSRGGPVLAVAHQPLVGLATDTIVVPRSQPMLAHMARMPPCTSWAPVLGVQ